MMMMLSFLRASILKALFCPEILKGMSRFIIKFRRRKRKKCGWNGWLDQKWPGLFLLRFFSAIFKLSISCVVRRWTRTNEPLLLTPSFFLLRIKQNWAKEEYSFTTSTDSKHLVVTIFPFVRGGKMKRMQNKRRHKSRRKQKSSFTWLERENLLCTVTYIHPLFAMSYAYTALACMYDEIIVGGSYSRLHGFSVLSFHRTETHQKIWSSIRLRD